MAQRSSTSPTPAEAALRQYWRVAGLLKRLMEPHFARFGISPAQWGILRALHRCEANGNEPLRVTDLSSLLLIRPPSVSGVVDRLKRMRLVSGAPSSGDMRFRRVRLTNDGRTLVKQALAGHSDWIGLLMAGLTIRDQRELLRLLTKMGAHLEPLAERSTSAWSPAQRDQARAGKKTHTGDGADEQDD